MQEKIIAEQLKVCLLKHQFLFVLKILLAQGAVFCCISVEKNTLTLIIRYAISKINKELPCKYIKMAVKELNCVKYSSAN